MYSLACLLYILYTGIPNNLDILVKMEMWSSFGSVTTKGKSYILTMQINKTNKQSPSVSL